MACHRGWLIPLHPLTPMAPSGSTPEPAAPPSGEGDGTDVVILEPRYWVPLGVTLLGPACLLASPLWSGVRWLTLALVLFGGFLLLQARLISLRFSSTDLEVWSGGREIRRFPYAGWLGWKLFWPGLPILFYFRETRSIHLLPVLFDAASLRGQLEQRLAPGPRTPTP
jgi:hypothetical protein